MKKYIYLLCLAGVVIIYQPFFVSYVFADTQTRYHSGDTWTVNNVTSLKLGTIKDTKDGAQGIFYNEGTAHYYTSLFIVHADGSVTGITGRAGETTRTGGGSGLQTATWNCPGVNLTHTDAIGISEYMERGQGGLTETRFITEQLGCDKLDAVTWTFQRYTSWGSENLIKTYWGTSYGTNISGISYSIFKDIGLRIYDGSKIIKVACEPSGILTSPLRVSKNGVAYGIVLVDLNDSAASKIRIKTASGVKAVRKIL